jgi:hypothetical protein
MVGQGSVDESAGPADIGNVADDAVVHAWTGAVQLMQARPDEGRRMLHSGLELARGADPADVPRVGADLTVVTGAGFRSRDVGSCSAAPSP